MIKYVGNISQVWIKLNATLWPRTQEDKEQVSRGKKKKVFV